MTPRSVLVAAALAASAAFVFSAAPAVAHSQDHWSGVWHYTADGGVTYGTMRLTLHHDHRTLAGSYTSTTSGSITGALNEAYGPVWCGKFRDTHGKYKNQGRFCATIQSDTVSFQGWYNTCYYLPASLCPNRYAWSGEKQ